MSSAPPAQASARDARWLAQAMDPFRRNLLFDLNEVAALEGLKMTPENFTRLQLIQNQLLRHWGEKP